jgi:hypothetical protein
VDDCQNHGKGILPKKTTQFFFIKNVEPKLKFEAELGIH